MPHLIGKRNDSDGRNFGVIDHLGEIAIWNCALSTVQVATLWNNSDYGVM